MNAQAAFDILSLELTIFATLLGFISVMFIFWYGLVKDKLKNRKPKTIGGKIQKIAFHLSFYLFGIFIIFGFGGIWTGVWILNLLSVYTEPLSSIYLESGVYQQLLFFTQWFSLWTFFTMCYIVFVLLAAIWPRIDILKLRRKKKIKCKKEKQIEESWGCHEAYIKYKDSK